MREARSVVSWFPVNPAFWPELCGATFLFAGLAGAVRPWSAAPRLDRPTALGLAFIAGPLATFGAEHFVGAQFIAQMVPSWMPARLFWAYFVGGALFATALSFVLRRLLGLSATLYAFMVFLFVLLLHFPNAALHPGDRFAWAVALRDLTFSMGVLAFANTRIGEGHRSRARGLLTFIRLLVGIVLLFFSIEHLLHPGFAPGVPLPKVTPAWFPAGALWAYLTGAVLLAAAAALLVNRHARAAAIGLGLWLTLLTVLLYGPILGAAGPSESIEAVNYVADTLLFAGTVLVLAQALPEDPVPSVGA
jgi:uncharacterized membrane protein